MKIILTGGGTAGHVSGNMALVPDLKKNGYQIEYIGSHKGMEKDIVAQERDIVYHSISSGRFRRNISFKNFTDIFNVLKGINEAERILKNTKPDIVFSKGGYVAVPVVIAAKKQKIPVIIHESDLTPGLANKISAKFADKICTTFPDTVNFFNSAKAICTGSPIRKELFKGNAYTGRTICNFTDEKPILLIMGGSLGSQRINELIRESSKDLLKKFNLIHICGKGGIDTNFEGISGYRQFEYVSAELAHIIAAANIVVSRAGSNAIFEFLATQKPMLLIPLPKGASRGDQILNAESFEKNGFAMNISQDILDANMLSEKINELYSKRDAFQIAMQSSPIKNGTDNILSLIYELSKKNK